MDAKRGGSCASVAVLLSLCAVVGAAEPSKLVARWTFDEGSGSIAYDSAGTHHGQIKGSPTWVQGVVGQALHLNGSTDYVEVPDSASLRPGHITISAWIKMDAMSNQMMVVCKSNYYTAYEEQYALHVRMDNFYWRRAGMNIKRNSMNEPGISWYRVYSQTLLEANVWYLVTGTWDGEELSIYVNGALEAQEWAPPGNIDDYPGGTVRIGRWRAGDEQPFRGCIDDVRIYSEALSGTQVEGLYSDREGFVHVDGVHGKDSNPGNAPQKAFATIQKGIDAARDGDTVLVYPGVYREGVSFKGKAITVRSEEDAAIIDVPRGYGVVFDGREGAGSVLKNFVIKNAAVGVCAIGSSPTLKNLTVVSCGYGIIALSSQPVVSNCILWGNTNGDLMGCTATYTCTQDASPGFGNTSADPLFADPLNGDYHLSSERGMYWPGHAVWILGERTSPCIDSGNPADDCSLEPQPNGGQIDMGAHGGTPYASRSTRPQIGQWRAPVPLTEVNSDNHDKAPFLSYDGLTLYFSRHVGSYARIFKATRPVPSGSFGSVQEITSLTPSSGHVSSPWVSHDNLRMYYYRTDGSRSFLQLSQRSSSSASWPSGVSISELNAIGDTTFPSLTGDELVIFFNNGGYLYTAKRSSRSQPFGNVTNLCVTNDIPYGAAQASLSPDGLTLYYALNINGIARIYRTTRPSRDALFAPAEVLPVFDTPGSRSEYPCVSADGKTFYYASMPPDGDMDIYVSYLTVAGESQNVATR
jgi:hypothetical protein